MKMKQIISALILFSLLLSTSCADAGSTSGDNDSSAVNDTETETEPIDYLDLLPVEDFDGYEFRIIAQSFDQRPNLPSSDEENGEVLNDALIKRNRAVEERYNIKFVNIADKDRAKVTTLVNNAVMADEEAYDLVINSMSIGINTLAANGALYDLASMKYLSLEKPWWCKSIYSDLQINGHLLFTSGSLSPFYYYTPISFAYNKTLTDNYGITGLEDLVLAGKWTFDKMKSLATDCAADLDGNSKMDQNDQFAVCGGGSDQLFGFGLTMVSRTGPASFEMNFEKSDFVDKLTKVAEFCSDKNIVFTDTDKTDVTLAMFREDKLMFYYTAMNNIITGYGSVESCRSMRSDYGILPIPKYDEVQEEYWTYGNPAGPNAIAVPITCSDPDRTSLIVETLAYYSYDYVKYAAYDSIVKSKITRVEKTDEMLDILYSGVRFDLNSIFNFGGSSDICGACARDIDSNITTQYAAIKSKAEAELAQYIENLTSLQK